MCDFAAQTWVQSRPSPPLVGVSTDIARAIRARGADDLLALKDNWPTLAQDVRLVFDTAPASAFETHQTTDGDHGRIEGRRHRVTQDVAWLTTDRRFPGEPRFPDLAAIGMVEAEGERDGQTTGARRFFLSSAPLSAAFFARAVRAHRGVENRLHWVMDVVFDEDLMRLRTDQGPANMATLRHRALNLLQAVPGKSLAVKRKAAGWDENFLLNALKLTAI